MQNIALEILFDEGWQWMNLPADASITLEHVSPVWDTDAAGDFSHSFTVSIYDNYHIFGNANDMHGQNVIDLLYGRKFRLYLMGIPYLYGIVRLDQEVTIENGEFDIELASNNRDLKDRLDGVSARDVVIYTEKPDPADFENGANDPEYIKQDLKHANNIQIGYCVPTYLPIKIPIRIEFRDAINNNVDHVDKTYIETSVRLPKILLTKYHRHNGKFVDGEPQYDVEDFTNVQLAYGQAKSSDAEQVSTYCNARICYQQQVQNGDNWENQKGYCYGEPDRVNSAPCFYVMFWMDELFKQMGIKIKSNSMNGYEDLKRLAFFHTDCHYSEEDDDQFTELPACADLANLSEHGGSMANAKDTNSKKYPNNVIVTFGIGTNGDQAGKISDHDIYPVDDGTQTPAKFLIHDPDGSERYAEWNSQKISMFVSWTPSEYDYPGSHWDSVLECLDFKERDTQEIWNMPLNKAYANSDNFPDEDATAILDGIQNAFGIRYLYDGRTESLDIVMVKDILSQNSYERITCDIYEIEKTDTHVNGFRLKYSQTSEAEKNGLTDEVQLTGVKEGTEGDDTTYSYNNYTIAKFVSMAEAEQGHHDYPWLMRQATPYNKRCYVMEETGNAFRIKVDSESNSNGGASLFQVGQMQPACWGNCENTQENKDFIEEVEIGFSPVIENDINAASEKRNAPDSVLYNSSEDEEDDETYSSKQILAQLIDEGTRSYNWCDELTQKIEGKEKGDFIYGEVNFDMDLGTYQSYASSNEAYKHWQYQRKGKVSWVTPQVKVWFRAWMLENWDLASGDSPSEGTDSGFTLGIMRSSGSKAHIEYFDRNYDGKGNSKWTQLPGSEAAFTADSIDQYGKPYDYNGITPGFGTPDGGYISLILRSGKENPYHPKNCGSMAYVKEREDGLYIEYRNKEDGNNLVSIPYDPKNSQFPVKADNANRGLGDKFYTEYAYWMLNRKIATMKTGMNIDEILRLKDTTQYRIGDIIGFIKQHTLTISMEKGIESFELQMYYI